MKKIFITLLFFMSLCLFIFSIVYTYARYSSEYEKTTNINLTKWQLIINDSDISNNKNISSTITPVFDANPHISEGIIAPTSTGYFDIEIDCSNTDLSFSYEININNTDSNVLDFKVVGYSLNNSETILYTSDSIHANVLYSDNTDTISYRFFIEWDDTEQNVTNNLEDTQLSINNSLATINIDISLKQIIDTYDF